NNIFCIEVDHNNTKWIGTDAGVCRYDGETWTTFNTKNSGLCDNKVNAIAVEKNNTIWFGTDNGVSRYTGETITTSVDEENQTPESIPLIKSYPNPFNPSTTIEFTLPESGFATVTIYSLAGQKIRELTADFLPAGTHTLSWDGKDVNGNTVSSGIYITRLQAGKHTATGRMVLVR
ncbi:MAG: T9SS type A sorting domain-containing protein, partial [Candidatus Latescibacteria bacterium]|nr:T9SS type A sorting domain-containing protein [Candidatus Latescibacterota bacterium]